MKNDMRALLAFATAVTLTAGGFTAAAGAAAAEVPTTAEQASAAPVTESPAPSAAPVQPVTEEESPTEGAPGPEVPAESTGPITDAPVPSAPPVGAEAVEPAEAEPTDTAAAAAVEPAPASPTIQTPADDFISVDTAGGAVGTRVPVAVGGTAVAGAVVEVTFRRGERDGATQAPVSTTVGDDGTWSVAVVLESGDWSFAATQQLVDVDGVPVSDRSAPTPDRTVRLSAQTAPAPTLAGPAAGAVYAAVPGAPSPHDRPAARVPVSGTGTPGAVVRFLLDGTEVLEYDGGLLVGPDGSWATTVPAPAGTYRVAALQDYVDGRNGYVSQSSPSVVGEEFTVVEAATLPAPVVTSPVSGAVFDTLAPETDGYVTVTAEGTGVPGAILLPFVGTAAELEDFRARNAAGEILPYDYPIVVDESGRWQISGMNLPGTYFFTAVQYDPRFSAPVFSAEAPVVEFTVRAPGAAPTNVPAASGTSLVPSAVRPPAPSALAYTGADHGGDAALAGLALLALGSVATLIGRRRRRA
ncbi:hypothetical protein ES689_11655 [Frigoribacterium sp. ACAM 257]|uniref:hypothetical protein n=1 Tax=Frigoribacterium sp. ACAM 257 TaxID=2508998 RepID=UPI0011B952ED|nr:hypothetical protein [Frigoribacterium sp. ACAM 257]TWX37297.1 hypothetical protein ES689_11655 [Frigoribacterium sp. ACAM 257]